MGRLTIVMPVLNEAALIVGALQALMPLRARGAEVIVADGGSRDGTAQLAEPLADRVIFVPRGRAAPMNAGAALGCGDTLLFLHADTTLPENAALLIEAALARRAWGRFDLRIAGRHPLLAVVGRMINWRSRLTGIATGDQAIFVTRAAFASVGGFPDLPLMEDIAISRRLKKLCRPFCIATPVVTSGRRWEHNGLWHTIFLMWRLRLGYYLGVDPALLAKLYGSVPGSPAPNFSRRFRGPYCGLSSKSDPSVRAILKPTISSRVPVASLSRWPEVRISDPSAQDPLQSTRRAQLPPSIHGDPSEGAPV